MYDDLFNIIKNALWSTKFPISESVDWHAVFSEMQQHAVATVPIGILTELDMPDDVRTQWKKYMYQHIFHYQTLVRTQNDVLRLFTEKDLAVVVLKGTAAAGYYPMPEYRTMGDIDLLVAPNDYDKGVSCLLKTGWIEKCEEREVVLNRHRSFEKNSITLELHHVFSSFVNGETRSIFDEIITNDIELGRTQLNNEQNGLVLINHVAQHLRGGIGLRQIVDWMMYVDKCLDDLTWKTSFDSMAKSVNMDKLAKVVTRSCQLFLGLRTEGISWCNDVNPNTCNDFIEYIMACGNFGNKRGGDIFTSSAISSLPSLNQPIKLIKYLQNHGKKNWKALANHPFLSPFAWIYQAFRTIEISLHNHIKLSRLPRIWSERRRRKRLFQQIGI